MLNKVFKFTESRGCHGGVDYLLGNKGRSAAPELLRGNEAITRQLLIEATGKRAYTTGVCSFEELASDVPFEVQEEIMDLYEKTLMAGFPSDHYDMIWVRHTDKGGRLELNWHIVNQDLKTGRVIQPYYHKQDQFRLDLAKQIINDKYGFASPDDPSRERELTAENNFGSRKEVQEKINNAILNELNHDRINNRDDVINYLNNINGVEVSKVTASAISIKITNNDDFKKPIRLKGAIFSNKFSESDGKYLSAKAELAEEYNKQRRERLESNIKQLEESNNRIAASRKRLLEPPKPNPRNTKRVAEIKSANISAVIEIGEVRDNGIGDVRELSEQNKISDNVESVDTSLRDSSNDLGHSDWESLVKEKEELIKKLNEFNYEYISDTRKIESSGIELVEPNKTEQSIVGRLIENFAKWLDGFIQKVSPALQHYENTNDKLAATSSKLREATERRDTTTAATRDSVERCHESCNRLARLLSDSGSIGINMKFTLLSNVKAKPVEAVKSVIKPAISRPKFR